MQQNQDSYESDMIVTGNVQPASEHDYNTVEPEGSDEEELDTKEESNANDKYDDEDDFDEEEAQSDSAVSGYDDGDDSETA